MTKEERELQQDFSEWIDSFLASLPDDYLGAQCVSVQLRQRFHEALALALQSRLAGFTSTLPLDTVEQKQAAVIQLNASIRETGLAFRCSRTGGPGVLVADPSVPGRSKGRIRLESRDNQGSLVRESLDAKLDGLELMPNPPQRELQSRRTFSR